MLRSEPPAASSAVSNRLSAAWVCAAGSPRPLTLPSSRTALPALKKTRSPARTAPEEFSLSGATRMTLIATSSSTKIVGCGERMHADHVEVFLDVDPFVRLSHVVRGATIDVGRHAAMTPVLGVRCTEADCRHGLFATELPYRPLEDADHRVLRIADARLARMRPDRRHARLRITSEHALDLHHHGRMGKAHGQADVDFDPTMAGQHVDLQAALDDARRHRDPVEDARGTRAETGVDSAAARLDGAPHRVVLFETHILERIEIANQVGCDPDRVRALMRVGRVRAGRVDLENQSQRALLAKADHRRHAWLAVKHAFPAELVRVGLDQPLRAPGAARLLV